MDDTLMLDRTIGCTLGVSEWLAGDFSIRYRRRLRNGIMMLR